MKKRIIFVITLLIAVNLYGEKKMVVQFSPSKVFNADLDFLNDDGYSNYNTFMTALQNSKRVLFTSFVPKTGVIEGEYTLFIYEDSECAGIFTVVAEDYVYDEINKCTRKTPNILNNLRSILFIEYLRSKNK